VRNAGYSVAEIADSSEIDREKLRTSVLAQEEDHNHDRAMKKRPGIAEGLSEIQC
jgi:hypothetical protein